MMIKHELMCFQNPDNRRDCHSCEFLEKKSVTISVDYYGQESERSVDVFHCSKLSKFLYTPQNEVKKNYFDLGDHLNEPMPKVCDQHSLQKYFEAKDFI